MTDGPAEPGLERLMSRSLLDVFDERDAERRRRAIAEVYDPDVAFFEHDAVVRGPEALSARVQELLDGVPPDWVFRPAADVSVNHDLGRLPWTLGPAGGPPVVRGTDVAIRGDGRIRHLYVFIEA